MHKKTDLSLFSKHWVLKLLSLIIGASLWYIVAGEDQFETTMTVPLELHNLPADLVIANQYKREIEVSIRGPRRLIRDLRQQNITRPVNLAQAEPGALVIKNDSDSIAFPQGISVQRLQPTNITLLVDKLLQKDFVVTPQTKGKPAPGYILDKVTLEPERITLTGPQSILSKEPPLKTSVINLEKLEQSTRVQVHLQLSDALLRLIGETVIMANVTIREAMVKKTVKSIPVNVRDTSIPITVEPALISVEAEIPEHVIQRDAGAFHALQSRGQRQGDRRHGRNPGDGQCPHPARP